MNTWFKPEILAEHEGKVIREDAALAEQQLKDIYDTDEEIEEFLASLHLLENLPIDNIVPDERLLPPESLRFFYIDSNWIAALVDGVQSIGRTGSRDTKLDNVLHKHLFKTSYHRSLSSRSRRFALAPPSPSTDEIRTGFLLRSELVQGWPGLEVQCFQDGRVLDMLRHDILGGDVMLCIVEGILDEITLTQGAESPYFGFVEKEEGKPVLPLVSLKDGELGQSINTDEPILFRTGLAGVLDIRTLADKIENTLVQKQKQGETFSSAEFGVELAHHRARARINGRQVSQ
ncbi:MAG: hypothetical protein LBT16_02960 [Treponema sp.]|jgi:hypothetical protein|nr:hypothetical protein [Treponema sp.]